MMFREEGEVEWMCAEREREWRREGKVCRGKGEDEDGVWKGRRGKRGGGAAGRSHGESFIHTRLIT